MSTASGQSAETTPQNDLQVSPPVRDSGDNENMVGKRGVLRTGFAVIIGLLVLSTFTAYRVQEGFSKRTTEIHAHYVQQQEIITNLRRSLWLASIVARDFFLNTAPDSAREYLLQLKQLRNDTNSFLDKLASTRGNDKTLQQLRTKFEDLWATLNASAAAGLDDSEEYSFVQQQIVPRRDAAGLLLRQLEKANERSMTESQEEFEVTRRAAGKRLVAMLSVGLLLGIAVSRFSLRYSENLEQQTAAQLAEVSRAKQELERLSARLMEIQEEERTRLSRELHDEIVQTLAVMKIEITQVQARVGDGMPEIRENLSRARDLAERTVRTVRNIALLLRPSLLDDLGLGPALQWQAEDFRRRTGVACELHEQGLEEQLPDAVKTCVYRVTQEALHNCEKHADATIVNVLVCQTERFLTVEIEDNGKGFAAKVNRPEQLKPRGAAQLGVLGMRERAASLGGSLTIESAPGQGAKVTLVLPLTPHAPPKAEGLQEIRV